LNSSEFIQRSYSFFTELFYQPEILFPVVFFIPGFSDHFQKLRTDLVVQNYIKINRYARLNKRKSETDKISFPDFFIGLIVQISSG